MAEKISCLVPGCKRKPKLGGLCIHDYNIARALIKSGATTREKLASEGKMLSKKTRASSNNEQARAFFLSEKVNVDEPEHAKASA